MPQTIINVPRYITEISYGSRILPLEPRPRDEFDQFERVARALVQVPKSEVDEKRRGYGS